MVPETPWLILTILSYLDIIPIFGQVDFTWPLEIFFFCLTLVLFLLLPRIPLLNCIICGPILYDFLGYKRIDFQFLVEYNLENYINIKQSLIKYVHMCR